MGFNEGDGYVDDGIPVFQVSEADIQTDDSRQKLFCRLLDTSSNKEQFTSLCRLLKLWPPLPQGGDR